MKTAISLPDELFKAADTEAARLGVSRSKLVQQALEAYLAARREAELTSAINRAVEKQGDTSTVEDARWIEHSAGMVREMLASDEWDK